jgi:hypothetical protein
MIGNLSVILRPFHMFGMLGKSVTGAGVNANHGWPSRLADKPRQQQEQHQQRQHYSPWPRP